MLVSSESSSVAFDDFGFEESCANDDDDSVDDDATEGEDVDKEGDDEAMSPRIIL